jgi:tetratricopeptide (TPR) repeat protein
MYVLSLCVLVNALCAASAHAKPTINELAKAHFELGRAQYKHGDYEGALREFDESFKLQQAPLLLYNAGLAARKAGHDAVALQRFEDYLKRAAADAGERVEVQRYVDELHAAGVTEEPQTPPVVAPPPVVTPPVTSAPVVVAPPPASDSPHPTPVYKKWWLWTVVGVVVVAGAGVGLGLGLSQGDNFKPTLPDVSLNSSQSQSMASLTFRLARH